MNNVHPLFKALLTPMEPPMGDVPCRVSADLAAHEASLRDGEPLQFDEYDSDLFHDICGMRLYKPVQELMLTLLAIEQTTDSFGDPDKARAFDRILPELRALREGVKDAMRDL